MFVNFNILNQLGSPAINSNTFANRPAAGQTGRLFVSTDTFEIYRDNGTGWDLIGGPGSSTVTGSGATGQVTYWTGTNTVSGENALFWDAAQNHLGINTATPGVVLDVHSAADVALQLNGTGATPSIFQQFLSAGVSQYQVGYNWNASADYRRFSIYDSVGAKETITIDQQSRYVGINFQYSSLTDQPQYMLDLSGGSFHTNVGQYLVGTPTDLTRSFAASGNANSIAVWLEEYGAGNVGPDIFFNKGRGTDTAKQNVQVGDGLGGLTFSGYLNTNFNNSASIGTIVVNLNTTNNFADADFIFQQTYNSTTTNDNFRIYANGGGIYARGSSAIGIIPKNWQSFTGLQIGPLGAIASNQFSAGNQQTFLSNNFYYDNSGFKYIATGPVSGIRLTNDTITFVRGISGTIDNIVTLIDTLKIENNGNILVNTSTDNGNKLQVNGNISVNGGIRFLDFLTPSTNYFDVYNYGIDNTWRVNYNGAGNDELILSSTGVLTIGASYRSGAPNGGTAANWKLGTRVAAAVVLDATQYIELDVNGTLYKLAIVT